MDRRNKKRDDCYIVVYLCKLTHCNFHRHPNRYLAHCLAHQRQTSIGFYTGYTVNCVDHRNLCPAEGWGLIDDEGGREREATLAGELAIATFTHPKESICTVVRSQQ